MPAIDAGRSTDGTIFHLNWAIDFVDRDAVEKVVVVVANDGKWTEVAEVVGCGQIHLADRTNRQIDLSSDSRERFRKPIVDVVHIRHPNSLKICCDCSIVPSCYIESAVRNDPS